MPVPRTSCDIDWGGREKRLGYLCIFGQRLVINAEMASAVYAARADASNEDRTPEHGQKGRRDDSNPNSVRHALWRMQLGTQAFEDAYADAVGDYVEARALSILLCHEVEKVLLERGESIPADKRVRASVSKMGPENGPKALSVDEFTRDRGGLRISNENLRHVFTREFLRSTERRHVWLSAQVSEACRMAARHVREGYLAEIRGTDEWPDYDEAKARANSSDSENHTQQFSLEEQANGQDEDKPPLIGPGYIRQNSDELILAAPSGQDYVPPSTREDVQRIGPKKKAHMGTRSDGGTSSKPTGVVERSDRFSKSVSRNRVLAILSLAIVAVGVGLYLPYVSAASSGKPLDRYARVAPQRTYATDFIIAPLPDSKNFHFPFNATVSNYVSVHAPELKPNKIKFLDSYPKVIKSEDAAKVALAELNAHYILWFNPDETTQSVQVFANVTCEPPDAHFEGPSLVLDRKVADSFGMADNFCQFIKFMSVLVLGQEGILDRRYDDVLKMVRDYRDQEPAGYSEGIALLEALALSNLGKREEACMIASKALSGSHLGEPSFLRANVTKYRPGFLADAGRYEEAYELFMESRQAPKYEGAAWMLLPNFKDIVCFFWLNDRRTLLVGRYRSSNIPQTPRFFDLANEEYQTRRSKLVDELIDEFGKFCGRAVRPGVYEVEAPGFGEFGSFQMTWKRPLMLDAVGRTKAQRLSGLRLSANPAKSPNNLYGIDTECVLFRQNTSRRSVLSL